MDNYIVSARKYRPQTFDSVVGQHTLTKTLKNAISSKRLAHAYLFCGPRGVGKTTCARIFAKAINCLSPSTDGEACNTCESCVAFNENRSFNIFELDAASNNSVEDIRQIIDQVNIPPQVGEYKVFIIDEVHMLSQAAFNAFLKTLEEPPRHVIFILATTEKHKVLSTILSRCQIYDFNRMEIKDVVNHLKYVAEKENIVAEDEALNVIAQKADGGMRDALSIFDQVSNFSQGNITYQLVIENLNVLDYDYYFKITDELLSNKIPEVMLTFDSILSKGFEGLHFMGGLASHFRDLMMSKQSSTLKLLEFSENIQKRYALQSQKCSPQFLYKALRLCNNCDINYRTSRNKRLLIELTLIEIAQSLSDDEGSGRGPIQIIKPLFQAAKEDKIQPKKAVQVVSQNIENYTSTHSSSLLKKSSDLNDNEHSDTPNHVTSVGLQRTVSIRKVPPKPNNVNNESSILQENYGNKEFTEEDMRNVWMQYAQNLPIEQSAFKGRMTNLVPKLIDKVIVDVPVENDIVMNDYKQMKSSIEHYLKSKLSNSSIHLAIRLLEREDETRVYGKKEQLQTLLNDNKAFSILYKELNLVLE